MSDLQNDLDQERRKNSQLKAENEQLSIQCADGGKYSNEQKILIAHLEQQKEELEAELEASEESREQLKLDLNEANEKIIQIEEELYESKTI